MFLVVSAVTSGENNPTPSERMKDPWVARVEVFREEGDGPE